MVAGWAPTPAIRDAIGKVLEPAFKLQPRIVLPDNTVARLLYRGTIETDTLQKQRIYRRNLLYEVEFALITVHTDNTVTNRSATVTSIGGTTHTTNI